MRLSFYIFLFLSFFVSVRAVADSNSLSIQKSLMGETELITCMEGIGNKKLVHSAIKVKPHNDWTFKDLDIHWDTSDSFTVHSFVPLYPEEDSEFVYPVIFNLKQNTKDITLSASGTVTACQEQQCSDFPFSLKKTLSPSFAVYSPQCIKILHAFNRTPQPMSDNIQGSAILKNNHLNVLLYMPHNVKRLKLFTNDRIPLEPQNVQIDKNKISFDLEQTAEPKISFIIETQQGIYEVLLPVLPPGSAEVPRPLSFLNWVTLIGLYLLISPLFMVWGCHFQHTKKDFKLFCRYIQIAVLSATLIGIGCAWFPQLWQALPLGKVCTCLLILATFIWGKFSAFLCTFALIFMPKPLSELLQQCSVFDRIMFILTLTVSWTALFQIQSIYANPIHNFLNKWHKESPYGIYFSFSVFWILLLIYTIVYL